MATRRVKSISVVLALCLALSCFGAPTMVAVAAEQRDSVDDELVLPSSSAMAAADGIDGGDAAEAADVADVAANVDVADATDVNGSSAFEGAADDAYSVADAADTAGNADATDAADTADAADINAAPEDAGTNVIPQDEIILEPQNSSGSRSYYTEDGKLAFTVTLARSTTDFTQLIATYTPATQNPAVTGVKVAINRNENPAKRLLYTATKQSNGSWRVVLGTRDFDYLSGEYRAEFYTYNSANKGTLAGVLTTPLDTGYRGKFHIVSDFQLDGTNGTEKAHVLKTLSIIRRMGTDGIVVNGDMIENSTQAEYNQMFSLIRQSGFSANDFYFNMGNHEVRTQWGESFGTLYWRYLANTGLPRPYYETVIDGQVCLFIGSDVAPASCVGAHYSKAQLTWLDKKLKAYSSQGRPVFLFMHHPLSNTVQGSRWGQWGAEYINAIENMEETRAVIDKYANVVVFSSHTHWSINASAAYRLNNSHPLYLNTAAIAFLNNDDVDGYEGAQGWVVLEFDRGIIIQAYDFYNDRWITSSKVGVPRHVLSCSKDIPVWYKDVSRTVARAGDADNIWYVRSGVLDSVAKLGLMGGVAVNSNVSNFYPNRAATVAETMTILYRAACAKNATLIDIYGSTTDPKLYATENLGGFADLQTGRYYTAAFNWAYDNHLFFGIAGANGALATPDRPISRERICTILCRYAEYCGRNVSAAGVKMSVKDAGAISSWAQPSVAWAYSKGIMTGKNTSAGKMMDPKGNATRAELAKVFSVLVNNVL